jgi:hypothetical protein
MISVAVAGPAALLVAKLHKLADRRDAPDRLDDKDALDALRLLRATDTADLARVFRTLLAEPRSVEITTEAVAHLRTLFSLSESAGSQMAARAAAPLDDPATIAASAAALATDLLAILGG